MINNIIWDFDGTLFNTYPAMVNAFKKALMDCEIKNVSEDEIITYLRISVATAVNHFMKTYSLNEDLTERFKFYEHKIGADEIMPFPYARELCSEFQKSGGKNFILTHRDNTIFDFLKYHDMLKYFEEIATKNNNFKRKPDPEGFVYFLNKYNINNENTLAVGDRELDILGAKSASIKTCLYNTNNIVFNEKTDYNIISLSDLFKILCIR